MVKRYVSESLFCNLHRCTELVQSLSVVWVIFQVGVQILESTLSWIPRGVLGMMCKEWMFYISGRCLKLKTTGASDSWSSSSSASMLCSFFNLVVLWLVSRSSFCLQTFAKCLIRRNAHTSLLAGRSLRLHRRNPPHHLHVFFCVVASPGLLSLYFSNCCGWAECFCEGQCRAEIEFYGTLTQK